MGDVYLNFTFMAASILSLVFLNQKKNEEVEDSDSEFSDNEEMLDRDENVKILPPRPADHTEIYSTLLKGLDEATGKSFDRMPTFQEMMNPRRRCYSADDIAALDLLPDSRIKSSYDAALAELLSVSKLSDETRDTPISIATCASWDKLGEDED